MDRRSENKIIIVKRKTRLEDLITRFNTVEQAKFYIEHLGADFSDYIKEDEEYKKVVFEASNTLNYLGRVHVIDRMFLSNFIFGKKDLVIAIGQDGLVANTLKYLICLLVKNLMYQLDMKLKWGAGKNSSHQVV